MRTAAGCRLVAQLGEPGRDLPAGRAISPDFDARVTKIGDTLDRQWPPEQCLTHLYVLGGQGIAVGVGEGGTAEVEVGAEQPRCPVGNEVFAVHAAGDLAPVYGQGIAVRVSERGAVQNKLAADVWAPASCVARWR